MKTVVVFIFIILLFLVVVSYYQGATTAFLGLIGASTRSIRQLDTQGSSAFGNFK